MEVSRTTYRNLLLILSFTGLIFVLSLIYFVVIYTANKPIALKDRLAINNITADTKVRNGKLHYYNGNNFIGISLEDLSKEKLTDYNLLEGAVAIKWLENGAIFSFSEPPRGPELSKTVSEAVTQLQAKGLKVNKSDIANMYWHINFSDNSLQLLTYTTNPFGVSMDRDTGTIYFIEPSTDKGYMYFGSIDREGMIKNNIYGAPTTAPSRIIGQKDNELYIISRDTDNTINLLSFNTKSFSQEELINDIHSQSTQNHSIHEEYVVRDGHLFVSTITEEGNVIKKIDIESGNKSTTLEVPESSTIDYVGGGEVRVTDIGETVNKIRSLDLEGNEVRKSIVIDHKNTPSSLVFFEDAIIVTTRPYIYLKSKSLDAKQITVKNLDKDFTSDYSSLNRDIFSRTGDVNSYIFLIPDKPLSSEYRKLLDFLEENNIQKEDVTITPQLGARATYDLD